MIIGGPLGLYSPIHFMDLLFLPICRLPFLLLGWRFSPWNRKLKQGKSLHCPYYPAPLHLWSTLPSLASEHLHVTFADLGIKTNHSDNSQKNILKWGASLVAQWLRVCLPMQGTRVQALVREDPTCRGAARPMSHNYWVCASGACALQRERLRQWEARAPWWRVAPARCNWRKPSHRNEDPTQPKINKSINLKLSVYLSIKKKKEYIKMAKKGMTRCFTSLVIRKMQSKPPMRPHYTSTRITKL